ncbi:hypothetical protein DPMN_098014 [Dreissena polymorpha]|uniref:Uncharacterized protein n=1 Tax=Dreissena polymorpha TaxID=45954 RepID=A0A9D4LDX4_DREPO|nr:hypothetical protein DPMN_098014 [Dreissena polymorpha]
MVDIDFTKPKYGKKTKRKVNQRKPVEVAGLTAEEQKRALKELRICPTAGCLFKGV